MDIPPIVSAGWCSEHLDRIVFCDVRWSLTGGAAAGRLEYEAGHVPSAVFVDLDAYLAAPPSAAEGRHPLPTPAEFAAAMSQAGIGDDDIVVAYDADGGAWAARLVWMLRTIGCPAALLDGGLGAWTGTLETGITTRLAGGFTARPWPASAIATLRGVRDRDPGRTILLDARSPERFRGDNEPIDPRAGHVPGAVNVPFAGNLDGSGRFLDPDVLRRRFAQAGVHPDSDVVVSCGSGVTACHLALAMEHAGLGRPRVWVGSWSQWSADPSLPAARGADPDG